MSISTTLSSLSLSDPSPPPPPPSSSLPIEEQASLLRQQANAASTPSSSIPLYTSALALTPKSAPILADRAQAYLKMANWVAAYQDAVQALDDGSEGMDKALKVKCVLRAGEACVGGSIWDLAVIVSRQPILARVSVTLTRKSKPARAPKKGRRRELTHLLPPLLSLSRPFSSASQSTSKKPKTSTPNPPESPLSAPKLSSNSLVPQAGRI